jgi:hypothetical protein
MKYRTNESYWRPAEREALRKIEEILANLPDAALADYGSPIPNALDAMWREITEEPRRKEWLTSQKKNQARAASRVTLEEHWAGWSAKNLKVGMLVKVIGTRDGRGWRRVTRIHSSTQNPVHGIFTADQLEIRKVNGVSAFIETGYKTDHGFGKVRGEIELSSNGIIVKGDPDEN